MKSRMKAVTYQSRGLAREVLTVSDVDLPEVPHGEVLVRVAFSGVNPSDWKVRGRKHLAMSGPHVPHQDGSGRIVAVGEGVSEKRVGELVWVFHAARNQRNGTAAEFVSVPARQAVALPPGVSLEHAAMLGVPYMTAAAALRLHKQSVVSKTVLVAGGGGAVGSAAIQLAKWARAERVIATASRPQRQVLAERSGADVVLDYSVSHFGEMLRKESREGLDHVVEVALGSNISAIAPSVKENAELVVYGADEGDATLPTRELLDTGLTLRFMMVYKLQPGEEAALSRIVNGLLTSGLRPQLQARIYDMESVVRAHEDAESWPVGRVVLKVSDNV